MVVYQSVQSSKRRSCRPNPKVVGTIGLVFIGLGIFLLFQWPVIFDKILDKKLVLAENSYSYSMWKDVPVPVYNEFYLFNWTNPQDFSNKSTKPILVELGPYVYKEMRTKIVDSWNDNGTITFRQNRTWHFVPELSSGSEDDVITTINTVSAAAESACKDLDFFSKILINGAISAMNTEPFIHVKVREILFDGYDDPLLNLASMVPSGILPFHIPMYKFGWLHNKNGSAQSDGVFNMRTGAEDISKFGEIAQWNYMNKTDKFQSHCGALRGSAGELFPPHVPKNNSISIFSADICRSIHLNYEEESTMDGIPVTRYTADADLFAHEDDNPDNSCYCNASDRAQCPPAGVLDLSGCKWGASAYLSHPHFYQADSSYRDALVGMNPDPIKHKTFIELESKTRLPLQGVAAFQINILVQENPGFSVFEGVPKTYFPAMWFKQSVRMDEKTTFSIKVISYLPLATSIIAYIFLVTGFLLLILVFSSLMGQAPRKPTHSIVYRELQNMNKVPLLIQTV